MFYYSVPFFCDFECIVGLYSFVYHYLNIRYKKKNPDSFGNRLLCNRTILNKKIIFTESPVFVEKESKYKNYGANL